MSHQFVSLKCRVRYEGRVRTFDRRATKGADLERLPDPVWYGVAQSVRSKLRNKLLSAGKGIKPLPAAR
jgi:hypothetical protein